ncbi:beta-galactosidase 14 [Artemisia annua]|uniref:Beta-galactosidase n=1 Tax=Artemisia annua TaxID=35608 RepID=A0A2U1LP38_ARTAN|nr:beta-galactosidase 14 [Artemisia annua]
MDMKNRSGFIIILITTLVVLVSSDIDENEYTPGPVTYNARSVIVNGNPILIFSGSIHYPRSTPEMWPDIIRMAKEGGLNTIETYVFWNVHEPVQGQYNFTGNYDLVKFIKLIAEHNMYVILRLGPFIQAEWNLGGLPFWLRDVPGIIFRSYNEPYMTHMKRYIELIVNMMKAEKLFAPQGGPIILAQVENEYNHVQESYREKGIQYVKWAADTATGLYPDIPWIMCKQKDAPTNVISTCNGRHCADTFGGPNSPDKPSLWTENWTAQYRVFGDPPSQRAAEDISFSVARFFMNNGSMTNYYMYHGGTNFGRTSSSFVTTRYYDEAPLDEFGLIRDPKWSHLRDLHKTLRLIKKPFLLGTRKVQDVNQFVQIISQHNSRNFVPSKRANNFKWESYHEPIPTFHDLPVQNKSPLELTSMTKDTTDYMWYSTSLNLDQDDLPMRPDILPVIQIQSLGDALLTFVNGQYIGFGHGSFIEKSFTFTKPVSLKTGINHISILAMTVGLPNSGAYMEKRFSGIRAVMLQGMSSGSLDISLNQWGHKTNFHAPEGKNPVAIKMERMGKGVVWVNGHNLGRYWENYRSPLGAPSQTEYHIPRAYLKPRNNLLVVYEESSGNIDGVVINTVNRDVICSYMFEDYPPNLNNWRIEGDVLKSIVDNPKAEANLICDDAQKIIKEIQFVGYGNPWGSCGSYMQGTCQAPNAKIVVEKACLGKNSCKVPIDRVTLGEPTGDSSCAQEKVKRLAIQVRCGSKKEL